MQHRYGKQGRQRGTAIEEPIRPFQPWPHCFLPNPPEHQHDARVSEEHQIDHGFQPRQQAAHCQPTQPVGRQQEGATHQQARQRVSRISAVVAEP